MKEGAAVGLPICREDCIALRNHLCINDWATLEDNKRRGIILESRGHFRLPKCEHLPKYSNVSQVCTKTTVTSMDWEMATSE